jgi:hypothetical protein
MDTNARDEFNRMIYDIATDAGNLTERVQNGAKGLTFVEANQVPEQLKGELQSLKDLWAKARSMTSDEARQFISRIISMRDQLHSDDINPVMPKIEPSRSDVTKAHGSGRG